jgi:hypothetical protein
MHKTSKLQIIFDKVMNTNDIMYKGIEILSLELNHYLLGTILIRQLFPPVGENIFLTFAIVYVEISLRYFDRPIPYLF